MLRYKVVLPPYGTPGTVVRDEVRQHDIATCRTHADAANICSAMNFYNDWILVESESIKALSFEIGNEEDTKKLKEVLE